MTRLNDVQESEKLRGMCKVPRIRHGIIGKQESMRGLILRIQCLLTEHESDEQESSTSTTCIQAVEIAVPRNGEDWS